MHNNSIQPKTHSATTKGSFSAVITELAWRLLDCRGAGETVPALQGELNRRVYGLFGVSPDEVGIIIEGGRDEKG
jgi:hypothetical protein